MSEPVIAQTKPCHVDVEEGEQYAYCTCGLSDKQPFCNGAHKETGEFKPHVFIAEKSETLHLCGCKRTGKEPYCDGVHKELQN